MLCNWTAFKSQKGYLLPVGSGLVSSFNTYKRRGKGKGSAIGPNENGLDSVEPKFYQRIKKGWLDSTGKREKRSLMILDSDTVVEAREWAV